LPIDRNQIRQVDQIDNPQNGHEYLYMARYKLCYPFDYFIHFFSSRHFGYIVYLLFYRKMEDKLPPVMTATNVELQEFINKFENNAPTYVIVSIGISLFISYFSKTNNLNK